jgi:hypothetical protein
LFIEGRRGEPRTEDTEGTEDTLDGHSKVLPIPREPPENNALFVEGRREEPRTEDTEGTEGTLDGHSKVPPQRRA